MVGNRGGQGIDEKWALRKLSMMKELFNGFIAVEVIRLHAINKIRQTVMGKSYSIKIQTS